MVMGRTSEPVSSDTASFGSPGKMSLRFKADNKVLKKGKKKGKKKGTAEYQTILEVQRRHWEVATMRDTRLQALTEAFPESAYSQNLRGLLSRV
jgi:hypothetical protein